MKHAALLLALLLTAPQSEITTGEAFKDADPKNIEKHVTYLASDELEGRNAGYAGNNKAGDYLAGIFKELGLKPIKGTYFQPFDFRKRNDRGGPGGEGGPGKTRNVVGVIPGTDRNLKEEIVVVGAHYDHVGTSEQANSGRIGRATGDDNIWNGADDNGSGTATLLEVARLLTTSKLKPKRSILFILFSAEEHGLLGSEHYCDNPLFPLRKHVAMINLDMVGKGMGKLDISAVGTSDSWPVLIDKAKKATGLEPKSLTMKYSPDSDHASFAKKRIPAVFFFTGLHADYHKPSDHAERLDYEGAAGIARLASSILLEAATMKVAPMWTDPKDAGKTTKLGELGVMGIPMKGPSLEKYRIRGAGGVRVLSIDADSNGASAKLEVGDIIIGFNQKPFDPDDPARTLKEFSSKMRKNRGASVVVLREGKKKTLRVRRWK